MLISFAVECSILICIIFKLTTSQAAIVCSRGSPSFVRTANLSPNSKLRHRLQPQSLSAYSCHHHCNREPNCYAYFIHFNAKQCFLISSIHASFVRENLEYSDEWDFHQKLCLPAAGNCTRHWLFEKISAYQLLAMDEKSINDVFTEEQCMDACIVEQRFVCRSARYDSINKKCSLSKYDRHTAPESFKRINSIQIHYYENQCIQDPVKCSFRKQLIAMQLNSSHVYTLNECNTRDECERTCLNNIEFNCRSYTYDSTTKLCALSPQDSQTFDESSANTNSNQKRSLQSNDTLESYEKGTCISVEIRCEANSMTAVITTSGPFRGRLFTLTHPHECYNVGNEMSNSIALSIPLHARQCGTINMGNGTFHNSVVIQHHPLILRDSDRRVDVACDYHQIKRKLRGGKQVTESDTIAMTQVITGLVPTPPVSLRVVNASGAEVSGVELGEYLQLKVDMLDQSIFGIFGSELIARSGEGSESVALIDDRGCPIEPSVFPALERDGRQSKSLVAPFQAFRFAGDAAVKFQMTVSFCLDTCESINCNDTTVKGFGKSIDSFGRRRRRELIADKVFMSANNGNETDTLPSIDELQSGDILTDVTMETTLYVVNNLKPLGYADEHNKLFRSDSSNDNESSEKSSSIFGMHMNETGVCFTPLIIYFVIIIGCLSQFSVFMLCFWLFVGKTRHADRRGNDSPGVFSSINEDSNRPGSVLSTKTGIYETLK